MTTPAGWYPDPSGYVPSCAIGSLSQPGLLGFGDDPMPPVAA